jgi:serine/threonine-protein kinase
VLYFMATGHPPFRAEQPMAVLHRICNDRHRPAWEANPEIPDQLSDIIDRLLEKKPQRRFADAEQVATALAETLAALQQPSPPRRRSVYRRLLRNHRPWVLGTLAAAGIAAALGLAGYLQMRRPDPTILPPALAEVLASSASPRPDYVTELNRLEEDLARLEALHQPGASLFLQHADAAWQNSLADLERDLSRAEIFALVDPRSIIDPKPEGAKR